MFIITMMLILLNYRNAHADDVSIIIVHIASEVLEKEFRNRTAILNSYSGKLNSYRKIIPIMIILMTMMIMIIF